MVVVAGFGPRSSPIPLLFDDPAPFEDLSRRLFTGDDLAEDVDNPLSECESECEFGVADNDAELGEADEPFVPDPVADDEDSVGFVCCDVAVVVVVSSIVCARNFKTSSNC